MSYESYFKIRAALARDTFDGIPDEARKLCAETTDAFIARTSAALANTRDLDQARRAFGELSRAFIASPERSPRGPVYVVECSMAKPFGRWIQETREIGNPGRRSSSWRARPRASSEERTTSPRPPLTRAPSSGWRGRPSSTRSGCGPARSRSRPAWTSATGSSRRARSATTSRRAAPATAPPARRATRGSSSTPTRPTSPVATSSSGGATASSSGSSSTGPHDTITMGGTFTIVKVRPGLTSYADPGWYQAPAGTQADLASAGDLARDGIKVPS